MTVTNFLLPLTLFLHPRTTSFQTNMEVDDVLDEGTQSSFNFKAAYPPPAELVAKAHVNTTTYQQMLKQSYENNDQFWEQVRL